MNGVPIESRILTVKMDKPHVVRAEYRTETLCRVRVSSEFGMPVTDNPTGWYVKGQSATVFVQKEVPLEGWMGALGGKNVFVAWHSAKEVESNTPKYTFTVEAPVSLSAEWRTDVTQPTMVVAALGAVIVIGLVVLVLSRKGRLSKWKTDKAERREHQE